MTSAPDTLVAARRLLLDHLDMQPGRTVASDLDPAEVGIVGDPAHVGGYHCGTDRVRRADGVIRDYSVTESSRDRNGLADWACALDVGEFRRTVGGRVYDLPHLSAWIVAQCTAGTPDTRDIREVIWSPDGRTVRRWDRLGRRTTGDSSHRWHTHISYHRDAIKAGRDQTVLFRRYLTTIGLIKAPSSREDDMPLTKADQPVIQSAVHDTPIGKSGVTFAQVLDALRFLPGQVASLRTELAAATGRDLVDEQAIVTGVLAGLTPQAIAAAIPPELAARVADELAARLQS